MARAKPPPPARYTAQELEEALAPILSPEERAAVEEAPRPIAGPPVALPPSGEQQLETLKSAGLVREEGGGEFPAPPEQRPKRLTLTELGGRVETIVIDVGRSAYLVVERDEAVPGSPWLTERVSGRYGLWSLASVVLEDVEPEEA